MTGVWIEDGPISLPSRPLAGGAGLLILAVAVVGFILGCEASLRRNAGPETGNAETRATARGDELIARPIVDLAPPTPAPTAERPDADDEDDTGAADLAAQTAAAQAIQAKTAKAGGNIDDVLASPTEKPPATTKAPADESAPGGPVRSDVPF